MKKLIIGLFIFGFIAISAPQVHASILSDALLKIQNLQKEVSSLKSKLGAYALGYTPSYTNLDSSTSLNSSSGTGSVTVDTGCSSGAVYSYTTGAKCPNVAAPITPTTDPTPRISYWSGKVNQHVDLSAQMWQTDADGVSGADIDKLTYCKKWYPKTTSVVEYKNETINAWHDKGNINDYQNTRMSYRCAETTIDLGCANNVVFNSISGVRCRTNNETPIISEISGPRTLNVSQTGTWNVKVSNPDYGAFKYYVSWGDDGDTDASEAWRSTQDTTNFSHYYLKEGTYIPRFFVTNSSNSVTTMFSFSVKVGVSAISVYSPKVNETYYAGQTIPINWTKVNPGITYINFYKTDSAYSTSARPQNNPDTSGYMSYTFPSDMPTGDYKIYAFYESVINGSMNSTNLFESNGSFKIATRGADTGCANGEVYSSTTGAKCLNNSTPSITVLSPNGGETYNAGNKVTVKWKSTGYSSNSKISIDLAATDSNGSSANTHLMSVSNLDDDGVETLTIPNSVKTGSNYVLILTIFETSTKWQMAKSNLFTINALSNAPSITVTSPNGGEVYQTGQKITVKWTAVNTPTDAVVGIALVDSSNSNNYILDSYCSSSKPCVDVHAGTYAFYIPQDFSTGKYKVRVYCANRNSEAFCGYSTNSTNEDLSDNYFTINSSTTPSIDYGCSNGAIFSSTTGQRCSVVVDNGCSDGDRFSKTTGQLCGTTRTNTTTTTTNPTKRVLRWGLIGDDVKALQEFLGIGADGVYGRGTASKVKEWQASQGLYADGVFGNTSRQTAGLE